MEQSSEQRHRATTANCLTSTTPTTYTRTTELRHVEGKDIYELTKILDESDYWRDLMEVIPKHIDAQASSAPGALKYDEAISMGRKYSERDISLIKNEYDRINKYQYYSEIMFEDWKTSGKSNERPTLGVLLQLLMKAELFRAADFVAEKLLNEPKPKRPETGPAAPIKIDEFMMDIDSEAIALPSTNELNKNAREDNTEEFNKDCYSKHMVLFDKDPMSTFKPDNVPPKPPPRSRSSRQLEKLSQQPISTVAAVHQEDDITSKSNNQDHQQQHMQLNAIENSSTPSSHNIPLLSHLANSFTATRSDMTNDAVPQGFRDTNDIQNSQTQSGRFKSEAPVPLVTLLVENMTNDLESASTLSTMTTNASSRLSIDMTSGIGVETISQLSGNVNLPMISELNLLGERDQHDNNSMNGGDHCSIHNDSESSLSNDDEDDDDDNDEDDISLPNLSNFDQRSSNNDSSLTTVTGTSGDNSFELTNDSNDSVSNDENIPRLSALQQ